MHILVRSINKPSGDDRKDDQEIANMCATIAAIEAALTFVFVVVFRWGDVVVTAAHRQVSTTMGSEE